MQIRGKRGRGERGGLGLPSFIIGNVRSFANKMDEFEALTRTNLDKIATETYDRLHHLFGWFSDDRDLKRSRKSKGGGIAVLVNNRWRNPGHATVNHRFCSLDLKLLAGTFCPYYLQKEFTSVM